MVDKDVLIEDIESGATIWQQMKKYGVSKNTIRNHIKKHGVPTPKGFFKKEGSTIGRPEGIPMPEYQREYLSELFKGKNNPFYMFVRCTRPDDNEAQIRRHEHKAQDIGKKHTEAAKKKMSDNHADISGNGNPFRRSLVDNPEKRKAHRERARRRWASYSKEELNKIRERFSKAQCNKSYHTTFTAHKHGHHQSPKCAKGEIFFRSSWELKVAECMDDCSFVISYAGESFAVPYIDSEGLTKYTKPDFLVTMVSGHQILLEVKPTSIINYKDNEYKITGHRKYCNANNIQYALITEEYIKNPNNLNCLFQQANEGELYVITTKTDRYGAY